MSSLDEFIITPMKTTFFFIKHNFYLQSVFTCYAISTFDEFD